MYLNVPCFQYYRIRKCKPDSSATIRLYRRSVHRKTEILYLSVRRKVKPRMGAEVVLTSDRTLMSNYHNNEFLGFGTCAPSNFIPDWFYSFLFFPPLKSDMGKSTAAPYGLRKTEAQLWKEGFNVVTVNPDKLAEFTTKARIIGIHTMDPFGIGPAS